MKIFANRPLATACFFFALAVLFSLDRSVKLKECLLIFLFLGVLVLVALRVFFDVKGKRSLLALLFLGATLAAVLSSTLFFNVRYAQWQQMEVRTYTVEGRVLERTESGSASAVIAEVTEIDGRSCRGDVVIEFQTQNALQVGERFCLQATPRSFSKENGFDERTFYLSDGIIGCFVHVPYTEIESLGEQHSLRTWASCLNLRLSYRLKNTVGGTAGSLSAALLLGNRTWLSGDTTLAFRRAGVSHLLALSGLHLSILIGFLELLLRLLRCPRGIRAIVILLSGLLFLILTGLAVSTCRAYCLLLFLYLGYFLRESYDSFTALSVALVGILLVQPYAILDLSLWMSFLSAGAIIVFLPAVSEWIRTLQGSVRRLLGGTIVSLAMGCFATLSLMLLSALAFGELSLLSIPVTLLLSLPVTLLLVTSLLFLLIPPLTLFSWIPAMLGRGILSVVGWSASLSNVFIPMNDWLTKGILLAMSTSLILLAILEVRRRRWLFLPLLLAVLAVGSSFAVTHLYQRDVWSEQLLQEKIGEVRLYSKRGEAVLICDTPIVIPSANAIRASALDERCTEIDDLVFTLLDERTSAFIASLSERILIRDVHFPMPQDEREAAIAGRLEQEALLHGARVHYDAEGWIERFVEE